MAKNNSLDIIKITNNGEYAPIQGAYLGNGDSVRFPSIANEPGYENGCGIVLKLSDNQQHVVIGFGGFII